MALQPDLSAEVHLGIGVVELTLTVDLGVIAMKVLHIPQSSRIWASPFGSLVLYSACTLGSYPSAEMQLAYFTPLPPVDWAAWICSNCRGIKVSKVYIYFVEEY